MPKPTFFKAPGGLRRWLEENHAKVPELWVGFHKKGTGRPSITWPEAVDEALCFGWIDGVRYRIDEISYRIRFTPRQPKSIWSNVNVPWYQRTVTHWVVSAKQEETRRRRLAALIADCEAGRRVGLLARP